MTMKMRWHSPVYASQSSYIRKESTFQLIRASLVVTIEFIFCIIITCVLLDAECFCFATCFFHLLSRRFAI